VRLYVLDGGILESDPSRYELTKQDVGVTNLAVTAFLVVHPKGTLMWDTGAIADDSWVPGGKPIRRRLVLSDSTERYVTVRQTLGAQLKAIGYPPEKIQYLALSHYHWDRQSSVIHPPSPISSAAGRRSSPAMSMTCSGTVWW
jgi:hypothetical protein